MQEIKMSFSNQNRYREDSPSTISKRKVIKIKRMHPITGKITTETLDPPQPEKFLTPSVVEESKELNNQKTQAN